jgi:hypothetical protein
MHPFFRGAARAYGSGAFGGVAIGVLAALMSLIRLPNLYGVQLFPYLTSHHLSLFALWGGMLGLLFALPILIGQPIVRGAIFGVLVAGVVLIIVMPLIYHVGLFGERLGQNAWAFVSLYSIGWGIFTGLWYRSSI